PQVLSYNPLSFLKKIFWFYSQVMINAYKKINTKELFKEIGFEFKTKFLNFNKIKKNLNE
ncbi:MAG: hypothetical protein WCX66_03230, partial [archaeon]